jgi:hypothetical protein
MEGVITPPPLPQGQQLRSSVFSINTHKSDFYTQLAISTRIVWFSTHTSVILTRMCVNMTLTSVITTRSSVI